MRQSYELHRVRGVRHPVHGGREPVGVHRLRRGCGYAAGMADLPAERPVRHARADEGSRPQAASEVRGEPAENPPIIHL